MRTKGCFCFLLLCLALLPGAASASSVSATGVVDQVTSTTLRIARPDGTKLNATCPSTGYPSYECPAADLGEEAWGRATCSGGQCEWSCIEVVDECGSEGFVVSLSGTVGAKDMCAGVLYLTLLPNGGGEVRAPCLGDVYDLCDAVDLNDTVGTGIRLKCGDGVWEWVIPN